MVYDRREARWCDGEWHCPFPKDWVERMKQSAVACRTISAKHIDMVLNGLDLNFKIPTGEWLSEPQDARGLPISYFKDETEKCIAIYDYSSIPEVVITDGHNDWPLSIWEPIHTA